MTTKTEQPMRSHQGNVATLPSADTNNAHNYDTEKETIGTKLVVAFDAEKAGDSYTHGIMEPVDVRYFMGRSSAASVVYCSIWVRTRDGRYLGGAGRAGGYGYDKKSEAFERACYSAGIKLAASVGGVGDSAVEHAMLAIARACGYDGMPMRVV